MENNSLSIYGSIKSSNFLNLPPRKQNTYYNRGYNEALRICNQRAFKIYKRLVEAYQMATEEEFDVDDDDY